MQVSYTSNGGTEDRLAAVTRLLFKSARVDVEFTRDAWKQLLRLYRSPISAFMQTVNIRADLALYIAAHEDKGIFMDTECQEICYQPGMFFIVRKEHGIWYITDVIMTREDVEYVPVYFWTRVRRGCSTLAARALICWRRLMKRKQGNK